MGRDKAALPFGDETMLERVVRRTREAVADVVVSAGPDQEIPAGLVVVRDGEAGAGPLVALARTLPELPWDLTLVVACDMPLVEPRLLRALFECIGDSEACIPRLDGTARPTCAVYRTVPAARRAAALVSEGERRLQALGSRLVTIVPPEPILRAADPELRSFIQCNTPDEYRRALAESGVRP
jgi:molybdopterin-guanine dinucleotide biosynthesis protein A